MATCPASGAQYTLRAGGYRADISGVGASVRALRSDGRDIIVPFGADEQRPAMRGALLAPWPNRIADGRYESGGAVHQLPVNELATRNAAHGLVAWQEFEPIAQRADALTLRTVIVSQPGYPWTVQVDAHFVLSADGLRQEVTATNLGSGVAPFGLGAHPYLIAGEPAADAVDAWRLHVPAEEVLLISSDRMLPATTVDVAAHVGGRFDFRRARAIGDIRLNNAFTGLRRGSGGTAVVRLESDTVAVELECDDRVGWIQVYTSDESAGAEYRHAVAVEPMTCPPDAFNSRVDLAMLEPGAHSGAAWTVREA